MMKTEYDRKYQWYHDDKQEDIYFKKRNRDTQLSEPRMTHKRRVKLTEDNVVIGEPLMHQAINEIKENISVPQNEKLKRSEKLMKKEIKPNKKQLVNESVQTDGNMNEKSTQMSRMVPERTRKKEREVTQREKPSHIENNQIKEKKKESNEMKVPALSHSEYQTKYAWREPLDKQQPLTERHAQMKSSLDIKLKIYNNCISEYQRQFRPYEYVTESRFKKMKPTFEAQRFMDNSNLSFVAEKSNARRALTPPPSRALTPPPRALSRSGHAPAKARDALNPQRLSFPHGKQKRFLTEYSANFDNKWDRLDAEMNRNVEQKAMEANSQAKWFQEILELRQKAQEYRQRSRGTHFSREHLGQVYTKTGKHAKGPSNGYQDPEELDNRFQGTESPERYHNDRGQGKEAIDDRRQGQQTHGNRYHTPSPPLVKNHSHGHLSKETPDNRRQGEQSHGNRYQHQSPSPDRHHYNRYQPTPSPTRAPDNRRGHRDTQPRQRSPSDRCQGRAQSSGSSAADSVVSSPLLSSSSSLSPPRPNNRNSQSHWAGKPTNDDSLLLDEQASHDTDLKSSAPHGGRRDARRYPVPTERQYTMAKYLHNNDGHHNGPMKTLDYDSLSKVSSNGGRLSTRSLVSSSTMSLALDTLARAKRNRDDVLRQKS